MAGGLGTRLFPITNLYSKQLVPVYDKPLIIYPISTLMLAGIRQILIICNESDLKLFERLLGDGNQLGIEIDYAIQQKPGGIAEAFIIAEKFISGEPVCLILGDNIFYGQGLGSDLAKFKTVEGCQLFAYHVQNPSDYGVIELSDNGEILTIEEKPKFPRSKLAVTGLYFYDGNVTELVKDLAPSNRGELEITDLNNVYLSNGLLNCEVLKRGIAWLDTGTFEGIYSATSFVRAIEQRQGFKIACLEEIAWRMGWISSEQLNNLVKSITQAELKEYLSNLVKN